jgi:hypothetical protein
MPPPWGEGSSSSIRARRLAQSKRCENCREWPYPFLVFEESGKDPLEDIPERCPKCAYEPFEIIVWIFRCVEARSGVKSTPTIRETNLAGVYVAGDLRQSSAASTCSS